MQQWWWFFQSFNHFLHADIQLLHYRKKFLWTKTKTVTLNSTYVHDRCQNFDYTKQIFYGFILVIRPLTVLHHDGEEAHYDFGAGPDENLALATFLRVVDAFKRIGEDVHAHHDACKTPHTQVLDI